MAYLNESHVFHRNNWHHVDLHPQQAGRYIFVEETLGTREVRRGAWCSGSSEGAQFGSHQG